MSLPARLPARVPFFTICLALGVLHCGPEDEPAVPNGGGASGAGAAGKGGGGGAGQGGHAGAGGSHVVAGGGGSAGVAGSAGSAVDGGSGGASGAGDAGRGGETSGGEGGSGGDGGGDAQPVLHSILTGTFAPLPAYAAQSIAGQALLYRTLDGNTRVSVQVLGLQPATVYPSHVHNQPCAVLAGGHYLLDPAAAAGDANEIWLPITTNADGIGVTEKVVLGHVARGDALSIVVHDPAAANAKMVCADLSVGSAGELTAQGTFAAFAAAEAVDQTIGGTVELVRSSTGTKVTLDLKGLDPASSYGCHVHAFPCAVTSAGGHYKLDPTNAATLQENELWPSLGDTTDGKATGVTSFAHRARLDAQSVVIHRTTNAGAPKVACANLPVDPYPDLKMQGSSVLLPAATPGYTSLAATASLVRGLDGMTHIHLVASGLTEGVKYPAHVHNLPCSVQSGGGHYLRDKAVAAAEGNELWLPLAADHHGAADAQLAVLHIASADARSIVIHDPTSMPANARLACIDLHP